MIQDWFEQRVFIYIILGIATVGSLIKIGLWAKYKMLIRASKKMGMSNNKLMRVIRLKFETCYKLKLGVNNVDIFVDKYVYRHRFCGILLCTWEMISGEIVVLCGLCTAIFGALGFFYKCGQPSILSTLVMGVLMCGLLIGVDYFVNLKTKKRILNINMKDYLENFLKARLESDTFNAELLEQYRREYLDTSVNPKKQKRKRKEKKEPELVVRTESAVTKHHEKEVDDTMMEDETAKHRREDKKKEVKKMIEEDKKKREKPEAKEEERNEHEKWSRRSAEKKEDKVVAYDSIPKQQKVEPTHNQEEVAVSSSKEQQGIDPRLEISQEEIQVIEDILKEYLA